LIHTTHLNPLFLITLIGSDQNNEKSPAALQRLISQQLMMALARVKHDVGSG